MSSQLEAINMALGFLGQDATDSIDLDTLGNNRTVVRKVLVFADMALDLVLADHDWLEAQEAVNLAEVSMSGFTSWAKIYSLPKGFVRMSRIDGPCGWQVGVHTDLDDKQTRVLYADAAVTRAFAIIRLDWGRLPMALVVAVACKMAWLACVSVTGKTVLKAGLAADYLEAIRDAGRAEAFNQSSADADTPRFQDWRRGAVTAARGPLRPFGPPPPPQGAGEEK